MASASSVKGKDLWSSEYTGRLSPHLIGGLTFDLYDGRPMSLYESLLRSAETYADSICLYDDDESSYTFKEFLDLVNRFSEALGSRFGIQKGSAVGLLLFNSVEYCAAVYAVNRLGGIVIPYPTKYRKEEIQSLITLSGPELILYDEAFRDWIESLSAAAPGSAFAGIHAFSAESEKCTPHDSYLCPDESAPAILMFTSGTTSKSKGVVLTNFNVIHGILAYQSIFGITHGDRAIEFIPNYNVTGLIAHIGLFINAGGELHLHRFFDARRIVSDIVRYSITFLHGAPVVYSLLLEQQAAFPHLPSVRMMACGSGNMPDKKIRKLKEWVPSMEFRTVYGLTETSSPASIFPCDAAESRYIGSSGFPIPGTSFRITDDEGNDVPEGTTGTIRIRGSVVSPGYLVGGKLRPNPEGWLDTGDLGYWGEDHYLYVVDRKKDMINRGGEKICSIDVENVLYRIDGIREAAVVGIPDELYGEVPAAVICCEDSFNPDAGTLRAILKKSLASFQLPAKYFTVDHLPLTPNSKIDKKAIRKMLSEKDARLKEVENEKA